ncbi:hypothetical protein HN865_00460 [Candidatus Woesearchaeota archaeon]|jgi:hypothetical protein|nr:hypothetical protein [Candidatus Woesearchaeota archaeon]
MDSYIIFGIIGLLLISYGVITKKRKFQDLEYILGGLFLLVYSISIKNYIFIILQVVFIFAALWDYKIRK